MGKFYKLKVMHIIMLCIVAFFIISAPLIVILVNYSMRQESLREAEAKAHILLDRNLATHMYFSQILKPRLFEWTAPIRTKDYFDPSWMSSTYANREIQKYFQAINKFGYFVKDAAIDARNPENEADGYEKGFIAKLKGDSKLQSQSVVNTIDGKPYLVILRRGEVIEGSCLQCHSESKGAPSGLLARYGEQKGFHRNVSDLASVISMRIPLADAFAQASMISVELSVILVSGLALLLATQFFVFRRFLISPVAAIRDKALEIAGNDKLLGDTIRGPGSRELDELCDAFNVMSGHLRIGRDHLEERIRSRTNELTAANERLVTEVAERKQAEGKLTYIMKAVESASDAIGISDPQGRHIYQNKALSDLFGYATAEELQSAGGGPVVVKDPEVAKEMFDRIMNGKSWAGELEMVAKSERVFTAFERADAIKDSDGNLIGLIGIITDITDRKRAEEEKRSLEERLQRAEKMEALGQLAGGVAHDLNNVLGIMSGYSELLLDEIPEGSKSRGHVEKILKSTKKGAAIIDDLLTLARRGVTSTDVINVNGIISDFMTTPAFENIKDYHPRVTFRTECDDTLLNIKGSTIHLEKTLMNLVSNAAEAISGEGVVTIRTESIYLEMPVKGYEDIQTGEYAVLIVSDTGTGIPADCREKIFEPFYTKKKMGRSGTGLGLSIVWGTVKDHEGYIDLQTEEGEGTTFSLYFPVTRDEPAVQQEKVPAEQYAGRGESVLVVDDIDEQREIAVNLLTKLGYEVNLAASGEAAVEYLKTNRADILVLDMIMPNGMDGLDTYKKILEINPRQKAIIVSGFSANERVKAAQRLGVGAYVRKPYDLEKIGVALRALIKNGSADDIEQGV